MTLSATNRSPESEVKTLSFKLPLAFIQYLVAINAVGFVLFLINTLLYTYTESGQIDALLTIVSLFGGSAGIILSIFIFDRKAVKQNMMSRVFVFSILVIQIILVLILRSEPGVGIIASLKIFFVNYRPLLIYLGIINVATFITYGFDKLMAVKGGWRVRIITLLFLAFIGGSVGALFSMYIFHHKTNKDYFTVGVPLIMTMQAFVLVYLVFFR